MVPTPTSLSAVLRDEDQTLLARNQLDATSTKGIVCICCTLSVRRSRTANTQQPRVIRAIWKSINHVIYHLNFNFVCECDVGMRNSWRKRTQHTRRIFTLSTSRSWKAIFTSHQLFATLVVFINIWMLHCVQSFNKWRGILPENTLQMMGLIGVGYCVSSYDGWMTPRKYIFPLFWMESQFQMELESHLRKRKTIITPLCMCVYSASSNCKRCPLAILCKSNCLIWNLLFF